MTARTPRPNERPHEYNLRVPLTAMKVQHPYAAVARWCGGRVVRAGSDSSLVIGVQLAHGGEVARVGDYIAKDYRREGGFYRIPGPEFEDTYAKAKGA